MPAAAYHFKHYATGPMKSKPLVICLSAAALWCASSSLFAQALSNAPAPLPTDTQMELAKIEDLNALMQRADRYKAEKDMRRYSYVMERMLQLRPYSPTFLYRLSEAYAILDQKTKAYDLLIKIQKQGLAINPDLDKDFDPIRATPAFSTLLRACKTTRHRGAKARRRSPSVIRPSYLKASPTTVNGNAF